MPPGSSDKVSSSSPNPASEAFLRATPEPPSSSSENEEQRLLHIRMGKGGDKGGVFLGDNKENEELPRAGKASSKKELYLPHDDDEGEEENERRRHQHLLVVPPRSTSADRNAKQHADLLNTTTIEAERTSNALTDCIVVSSPHSHSSASVGEEEHLPVVQTPQAEEEEEKDASSSTVSYHPVQCVIEEDAAGVPIFSDIGAEVILSDLESEPSPGEVLMEAEVESSSSQQQQQLLEVPSESTKVDLLSRRWSYEEVVHSEEDSDDEQEIFGGGMNEADTSFEEGSQMSVDPLLPLKISLRRNLTTLTQWALTLQEVFDEREESHLKPEVIRCQCHKAGAFVTDLRELERHYMDTIDLFDRASIEPDGMLEASKSCIKRLANNVLSMQERLRSNVSISVSTASFEIRSRSAFLVGAVCDVRQYVREATDSVGRLVAGLLHANVCKTHRPLEYAKMLRGESEADTQEAPEESNRLDAKDEEMIDISRGVQALCNGALDDGSSGDGEDDGAGGQSPRKRKQDKTKSPPTSPTSSPSKRPRRVMMPSRRPVMPQQPKPAVQLPTQVLGLLEAKKKIPRNNGLRQFVLWREALRANKAEKERGYKTDEEEDEGEENSSPNVTI